ncbi:hypothetical protein [Thermoflexus sp.]|uniref:hypothetical protein n=1 Tax=Thermoflexus sp. TaxID=1969742 RepID=UPI002ADE637F|nr:hypothetical protein [Thermoflexus sp.]
MKKAESTIGTVLLILSMIAFDYYAFVWAKPRLARGEITWLEDKLVVLGFFILVILSGAMMFIPEEGWEKGRRTLVDVILSGVAIGLFVSLMTYLGLVKEGGLHATPPRIGEGLLDLTPRPPSLVGKGEPENPPSRFGEGPGEGSSPPRNEEGKSGCCPPSDDHTRVEGSSIGRRGRRHAWPLG